MSTLKIKRENGKIFCPLVDSWHIETPEEKVRQEYIKILVEDYGYSLDQMAQEIKVNNSQRGQGKARADIVIWKSKQDKIESKAAFIVVECKAENVRIREEDYYQGYNYASWAGASFFVTTNEKETKYINVDKDYLPKELVEVVAIPTAEEALNDKKVKDILSKTKTFTRDDFTKILRTCHNIIRNNDKLSPEAAFDEISKILFMKIKYEREQRGAKVFTKNEFVEKEKWFEKEIRPSLKGTPKDLPYMQFLFYNTKEEFKDDQLFEENEIIKIRQNSFEQILEKLETYNLSDTQDDVKGIAFEQFLGTTFRGELGQYFTPRTIVDFMIHILDPKENETVCDPTCGSGGFLIKAFEYMREKIEEDVKKAKSELRSVIEGENYDSLSEKEQVVINERIEAMQSTLNKELDTQVEGSRMRLMLINKYYWNVALLTLLLSSNETLKPFIENDLGITSISTIELKFNFKYFDDVNELLKTFINRINPDRKSKIECNLEDLRNSIFYSVLTDENGNILVDENGNKLLAEIGITDTEVFQNLTQAYMPKNEKIIKDIITQIDDDITVEQLSEGEKKLILVKTVLEILSDEKTLVLMDEPDAHLHEGKKPALCNMMREYPNRQIVIATHSPIMAQIANEKELLMLELENGKSTILTDEKIEKIKKLSGTSWDVIGQGMMLRSSRPLVVFEGKTDVMYVKRALEMLKSRVTDYASLNVDFLNANGAGNVKSFIDNLKAFVPDSKKIVVFFDRDNAGKDGVQAITGISKNDGRVAHYQDIVQDNITTSFIPYKDGVTEGDFLIEDYFSWDDTIKAIVEDVIPDRKHPIKMLPNLPDKIKKELEKRINKFEADEFNGFIPLLDKIVELTKEQAV